MLHILRSGETQAGERVLRAMFAARKQVFVDLLKWNVPVVAGTYEMDRFDDTDATYLVLAGADGAHLGSARLLRTDRPHILDSFYSDLCAHGVPRGPHVREVTRFCLDRRLKAAERREVRDTLVLALADHALANGIGIYSAIARNMLRSCADAFGRERLGHTHRPPGRIRWRGSIAKRGSHASASPSRRTRQTNLL